MSAAEITPEVKLAARTRLRERRTLGRARYLGAIATQIEDEAVRIRRSRSALQAAGECADPAGLDDLLALDAVADDLEAICGRIRRRSPQ